MSVMKKMVGSEVGKNALGGFLGNVLAKGIENRSIPAMIAVGIVALIVLCFGRKKWMLTQQEVMDLRQRVDGKRNDIPKDRRAEVDQQLMADAESLRGNWLNRKLYPGLCDQLRANNDLESILNELSNAYLLFGAAEFWTKWDKWCAAGLDVAKPGVGIDTRAEKKEKDYETKGKSVLVSKIVGHLVEWRKRFKSNGSHIFIKWIGANDVDLVSQVLRGFADDFPQGEIHVWLANGTLTDEHEKDLEQAFAAPDDGVTIEETNGRDNGYDVILSTHFWQHHSVNVLNHAKRELRKDGLFVLLAAVARDPRNDEYVCEGCMPMRATITDIRNRKGGEGVFFRPMGSYSDKQRVITYSPIAKYAVHAPVLSWGFPKSAVVDRSVMADDEMLAKWIQGYFQWGKESAAADFLRQSGDGMVKQPRVEVDGVRIVSRSYAVDPQDTVTEYLVIEIDYSIPGRGVKSLPFIVSVGYEKNEWRFKPDKDKTPITFHPAIAINPRTLQKRKSELLELVLIDSGHDQAICRYRPYMPEGPCATGGGLVWRIHTRIYEADLNDLLVFEIPSNGLGEKQQAFYSYFPKRRYLDERGYERGLMMLDRYKTWLKDLRDEGSAYKDVPIRFDSVTWLWSYQSIERFCKERSLRIEDPMHDVYFHVSYCGLPKEAVDAMGLSSRSSVVEQLFDSTCSVAKDKAFNQLQVVERVRLLACMNVHNVLVFARRNCGV